jgi:hypothetical protein
VVEEPVHTVERLEARVEKAAMDFTYTVLLMAVAEEAAEAVVVL